MEKPHEGRKKHKKKAFFVGLAIGLLIGIVIMFLRNSAVVSMMN